MQIARNRFIPQSKIHILLTNFAVSFSKQFSIQFSSRHNLFQDKKKETVNALLYWGNLLLLTSQIFLVEKKRRKSNVELKSLKREKDGVLEYSITITLGLTLGKQLIGHLYRVWGRFQTHATLAMFVWCFISNSQVKQCYCK